MTQYKTDEEYVADIKKFWDNYGKTLIAAIVIAIALTFGLQQWRSRVAEMHAKASVGYFQLLTSTLNGNAALADRQAAFLIKEYPHTTYAVFAALLSAQQAVAENKLDAAANHLTWAMNHAKETAFHDLAVVRLAKIRLQQKQYPAAEKLLNAISNKSAFLLQKYDTEGDLYRLKGERAQAHAAYLKAESYLPKTNALTYTELQAKIADTTTD